MGTRLADMIVPDVWNDYVLEKTAETNVLLNSGILASDDSINTLANGAGEFVNMPFFQDLTGEAERGGIGFDGTALTPKKITTDKDIAVKIFGANSWDSSDFAGLLSGAKPMEAIASRVVEFWNREKQRSLIASLNGVFAGALATTHVLDISANTETSAVIDAASTIDAKSLLGDKAGGLTAMAMHSATYAKLQKDQLIVYETVANQMITIPTYLGYSVIVDDNLPVDTTNGIYTTYLFGNGAVGYSDVALGDIAVETDRDTLGGVDVLTSRSGWIMHPRGVKWAVTTSNPTDADLATDLNWAKIYEDKNIRMIAFKHKLA